MARTWVATDDLVEKALPGLCARTGRPTESYATTKYARSPSWAPVASVAGVVPFLLVGLVASGSIDAQVPLHPAVERRLRRLVQVRNVAALLALAALIVWIALDSTLLLWLALAGLVVAIIWTAIGMGASVGGQIDETGDWVELRNVHRTFVAATDERYGEVEAR